jgi:iron complex outermembrane receptor protein
VWDVTPDIENYTIVTWSDSHTHGYVPKMIFANPAFPLRTAANIAQVAALGNDFWDVSNGEPNANEHIKQQQAINTTTWLATDTLTVKNIVSYGTFRQAQSSSIYGENGVTAGPPISYNQAISVITAPGAYNVSQSTLTEEIQLQGRPTENLNYQAGFYYESAKPLNGFQRTYSPQLIDCQDVLALLCRSIAGPSSSVSISQSKYTFRNRGIFAQSTYNFTDQWALTAGIRYTADNTTGLGQPLKVTFTSTPAGVLGTPIYNCSNPAGLVVGGTSAEIQADRSRCNFPRSASSKKPTWLIDLDYKPISDVLIYAKYARGYRQGGVNVSSYGLETWGPEKVDTYEAGAKTTFRSFISGTFNISAFYNSFSDQQLQLGGVICTTGELTTNPTQCPFIPANAAGIANAGKSLIKGIETETSLNLVRGLNLDLNYTYLKTVIQTISAPSPPLGFTKLNTAAAGGAIPLTPTNKFAATLSYTLPLPEDIGRITLSGNTTYQSSTFGSVSSQSSGLYVLPSQRLYNANINWNSILGQPVDLSLFSTNVTQRKFRTFTTGASFGFDSAILNEPRMFGARVKYNFGGK